MIKRFENVKQEGARSFIVVSKRLAIINALSSVATRFLNVTVLLWMYQYLIKRVTPEEFAIYAIAMAIMGFAPLFFSFFIGGTSRYVIDAYARGKRYRVRRIVSSMVPLLAAYSVVFLLLGLLFAYQVEEILEIPPDLITDTRLMLVLLVLSFSLQMTFLPLSLGFHVKQRFVLHNGLAICRDFLRIGLLFLFLFGVGANVIWIVVATVISDFIHLVLQVWLSRRLVPDLIVEFSAFNWRIAKKLISFGIWTTLGRLGNIMYTNAATIVLNKLGTAIDVTNYYLGSVLFRQMQGTMSVAIMPLQPAITAMNATKDFSKVSNTFLRGGRYSLWASMAVAAPLVIYSREIVQLYVGEGFVDAADVIVLFMLMFPFTQPTALLPMTAIATEKVKPFFVAAFLAQLIGLLLMLYFAKYERMGAIGVTLALTIITVGSQVLYFWPLSVKIARIHARRFYKELLLPGFLPTFPASLVWGSYRYFFDPKNLTDVFSGVVLGLVVYLATLLLFSMNKIERGELRVIVSKLRGSL